ncbi:MAG: DUF2933 domain-containing protein [Pyrinomonadaceae bacterium]
MKTSSKLIIILGIAAAFVIGLAAGAPLGTLLLTGALLACPAMMFFGMGMRHGGCRHCERNADNQIPSKRAGE